MEVFNSSGESGMAVIHMDDKQILQLKFQYRINISIVYAAREDRFDIGPADFNQEHMSGIYPTISQNNFNENLGVLEVTGSSDTANKHVSEDKDTIRKDEIITTPDFSAENPQSSTFILGDNYNSAGSDPSVDPVRGSENIVGLFDSNIDIKEKSIDKYRQVRENLNEIFQRRRNNIYGGTMGPDVNTENSASLVGVENEEEMDSDLDSRHEDDRNFSNADSDKKDLSGASTSTSDHVRKSSDVHRGIIKSKGDSMFPCNICQKVFESDQALIEHHAALTAKIKCLVCKEECLSRAHLMLHDYVAHTSQGNISNKVNKECPLCQETFLNDPNLVVHIKSKHTHEGVYKCCLCQKVFQTDSDYDTHTDICKAAKSHRKFIKSNKRLSTKVDRKHKHKKIKTGSAREIRDNNSKSRVIKKSKNSNSSDQSPKGSGSSQTKIKNTFKKQDKATSKLKKAKLNAQYYQKLKQQRLLKKQKEAEERAANGDDSTPAIIIEKSQSTDEKDASWDKTWKCKFCDRIFMNMREFNSHNMPMRTKRVCTKCGDRSKSKAEYLLHQCKRDTVEQEEGDKTSRGKRKCPVCEEEILKKEILKHVMFQHTSEMPYLCCICGVPLDSYESWISHCECYHSTSNESNSNRSRLFTNVSFTNTQNSSEIVCKLCKSQFYSEKDFVHHHKFETVRKVCNVCETVTFTEAGHIVHRYLSHGFSPEETHSLTIPSCYDSSSNLWEEDRFDEWNNEGSPNVKCPCCPDIVNTKELLFHVMEVHTRESPFKCCACENVSPSLNHYIQHCDFHLGKREYNNKTPRCLQCDLRFESRRALNSHKQFHQKRCPYCQMEFSSAVFLKIHLQNYHTNDMEACSFCGKLFACSTQLAEHERHHYFSKQSQCTVCGKLIFARNMSKHMKIAHPKAEDDCYFCAVCNKRFRDRHQMEQHQLCHSTDFTHECDVCKKKFKNAIRLREHAKVHLDKKRLFVCDICGKTCTEKYNLQVHMRVHSNTKEFHCPLCNQGFNYNQSLKSHMEKEHNKVSVGPQHFNCSFCNIPFGYIHTLEAHMREKHGYSATNYGPASQWY